MHHRAGNTPQAEGLHGPSLLGKRSRKPSDEGNLNLLLLFCLGHLLPPHLTQGFAPVLGNLTGIEEVLQCDERCLYGIDMVLGAKRLAEDVVDSGRIADRSNRTTGDNSGTGNRRLQKNAGAFVLSDDLMRNRGVLHRNLNHRALGSFHRLADRLGDVIRFPEPIADFTVLITYDHDRAEGEPASTLHDFCYAVDLDQFLCQSVALFSISVSVSSVSVPVHTVPLELDSGFPGAVGDRLDDTVVEMPVSVEHAGIDLLLKHPLSNRLTKLQSIVDVVF